MSTGGGILSPDPCNQFTPSPVPADTTTSTVTLTTSSASVSPAQDATIAIIDKAHETVFPVPITTQGEGFALVVGEGVSGDTVSNLAHMEPCISSTTADGKACSYANCGFVTTVTVPSGGELDEEYQWLQLQRQELTKHCTRVHNTDNSWTS